MSKPEYEYTYCRVVIDELARLAAGCYQGDFKAQCGSKAVGFFVQDFTTSGPDFFFEYLSSGKATTLVGKDAIPDSVHEFYGAFISATTDEKKCPGSARLVTSKLPATGPQVWNLGCLDTTSRSLNVMNVSGSYSVYKHAAGVVVLAGTRTYGRNLKVSSMCSPPSTGGFNTIYLIPIIAASVLVLVPLLVIGSKLLVRRETAQTRAVVNQAFLNTVRATGATANATATAANGAAKGAKAAKAKYGSSGATYGGTASKSGGQKKAKNKNNNNSKKGAQYKATS